MRYILYIMWDIMCIIYNILYIMLYILYIMYILYIIYIICIIPTPDEGCSSTYIKHCWLLGRSTQHRLVRPENGPGSSRHMPVHLSIPSVLPNQVVYFPIALNTVNYCKWRLALNNSDHNEWLPFKCQKKNKLLLLQQNYR